MDRIKVLVTGSGAPGIRGTIYSLKNNYDNRDIIIIGTDCQDGVIGKYLCDSFYTLPHSSNKKEYLHSLLDIAKRENIQVIIPQNTSELEILSQNIDLFEAINIKLLVSEAQAINKSNNKYALMKECKKLGIPVGKFFIVNDANDLTNKAKELGWPNNKIVVKPPVSNGSRGVRIVDESINLSDLFYNHKPTTLYVKLSYLEEILGKTFDDLIVTEYLPGIEYSVDVYQDKNIIIPIPRKRNSIKSGITFNGTTENNKLIIDYSIRLSKALNLKYCYGFQFKLDEKNVPNIIECNPRVQGTMVMSTLAGGNFIYSSVKSVLGEDIPKFSINWDKVFLRYWGGISVNTEKEKSFIDI